MIHPDLPTLERFAALALSRDVMLEIGHHVASCSVCRARIRHEIEGGAAILARLFANWPEASTEDYDDLFVRAEKRAGERLLAVRQEKDLAKALETELEQCPAADRLRIVEADKRFHNPMLVERLFERCRTAWGDDRELALVQVELAMAIVERLDPERYEGSLQNDLRARGWAFLANIHRMRYDFTAAHAGFANSERWLEAGSGDPLERGQILTLKSSLFRAQRRMEEALETIRMARRIYRRAGDRHLEGQTLVGEAMILGLTGASNHGIELLAEAVRRIDPIRDPRLAYAVRHNLIKDLVGIGRAAEAETLLPEIRRMSEEFGNREDRIRLLWVEGEVLTALGKYGQAADVLRQVQDQFLAHGFNYNTAFVSLDLAQVYLHQGLVEEAKHTAVATHAMFASHEIHREALAALITFQRAAEQETATVRMVQEVRSFLWRTHGDPKLIQAERPS